MRNVIIITGASSGLGLEFARQLGAKAAAGDELWLISRGGERLEEARGSVVTAGAEVKAIPMDVSGREGAARIGDLLRRERAAGEIRVSVLVNNAGFGTYGPFEETPLGREMEMVELNCTALTGICGECLPFMGSGSRMINVSSLAAFLPLGNFAVYAATKAFVLSLSFALAAELRERGISVTALCPGSVSTNFANVASNGARREVLRGRDPAKVVAHCLKVSERGGRCAVWALRWRLTALMSRFVGRYACARFTFLHHKRPWRKG